MNDKPNKKTREQLEAINLFADPKYSRQAFRSIASAIAQRPAAAPSCRYDRDNNETYESQVERYTWEQLTNDVNRAGKAPTEIEMMIGSQMVLARTNPSSFVAVLDRMGCKPVDESKVDATVNSYEGLSDEELEALAALRQGAKLVPLGDEQDEPASPRLRPQDTLVAAEDATDANTDSTAAADSKEEQ